MFIAGSGRVIQRRIRMPSGIFVYASCFLASIVYMVFVHETTDWVRIDQYYKNQAYENSLKDRLLHEQYSSPRNDFDIRNRVVIPSRCTAFSFTQGQDCRRVEPLIPKPYPLPVMPPLPSASGDVVDWHKEHNR